MPRNVRNFWIDADIDGRATRLAGGPVSKDGGIDVSIKMRSEGAVEEAMRIEGWAGSDGRLYLKVSVGAMLDGPPLYGYATEGDEQPEVVIPDGVFFIEAQR